MASGSGGNVNGSGGIANVGAQVLQFTCSSQVLLCICVILNQN